MSSRKNKKEEMYSKNDVERLFKQIMHKIKLIINSQNKSLSNIYKSKLSD